MSKKVYISREEVWNKVKDCMQKAYPNAKIRGGKK